MLDPTPEHPPCATAMPLGGMTTCGTAGQRVATNALSEALAKRPPLILLFGEMGVGKSTLLARFLATVDPLEFAVVQLSATGGEFTGPPNFDSLLEAICRQLVAPPPTRQRPATLAVLAQAVGTIGNAGRTVVIAIDHADHLRDEVIAQVAKLAKHLDVPSESLVCIFVGLPALASRLDSALRKPGAPERVTEIRVSQPSPEELAALLAYEDTVQPGGPMLTAGAIDRITVYAKSNLHWAVPLADAARTLAAAQGMREVTPDLVRGALLELWTPDQQLSNAAASSTFDLDGSIAAPSEMSDLPPSAHDAEAGVGPASPSRADASTMWQPAFSGDPAVAGTGAPAAVLTWHPRALWIALAALVLLIAIGIIGILLRPASNRIHREPPAAAAPTSSPVPVQPALPEPPPAQAEPEPSPPLQPSPNGPGAEGEGTPALPGGESVPIVAPAPKTAPPPAGLGRPAVGEKAAPAKKAPKAAKKGNEGTRGKWVQTR